MSFVLTTEPNAKTGTEALTRRQRGWYDLRRAAPTGLALVAISILAAACGGSTAPGVASVGSSPSTTVTGAAASGAAVTSMTPTQLEAMVAFAACVRKHGLPKFPDPPYANDELNGMGFTKNSPHMEAATEACHEEALAAGVVQTPADIQQHLRLMRGIAECMRAHGVIAFPDPNANGGFAVPATIASSPRYAAAAKTCGAPPASPPSAPPPA